jgi:hypothetical protein
MWMLTNDRLLGGDPAGPLVGRAVRGGNLSIPLVIPVIPPAQPRAAEHGAREPSGDLPGALERGAGDDGAAGGGAATSLATGDVPEEPALH